MEENLASSNSLRELVEEVVLEVLLGEGGGGGFNGVCWEASE